MDVLLEIFKGILEQGLIYSIMALGVYISYHILEFPDLSVDGTFPFGAAVTAMLLLKGVNPMAGLFWQLAACGADSRVSVPGCSTCVLRSQTFCQGY